MKGPIRRPYASKRPNSRTQNLLTELEINRVVTSGFLYPAAVYSPDQMESPDGGPSSDISLEQACAEFSKSKAKGDGGNYARQIQRVISTEGKEPTREDYVNHTSFIEFAQRRGVETVDGLSPRLLKNYAQYLSQRVTSGAITASTARSYWAVIRAWLSYCVEWEMIDSNPASLARVTDELPDDVDGSRNTERQFWQPDERRTLVEYVDEAAREAIDNDDTDPFPTVRDRALVCLLAYTGVRGAEVFRDPNDSRRTGLTWGDVHIDEGYLTVRGKSQKRERAALPSQARPALERLQTVIDPPTPEWPVFPSRHAPSLYALVREHVPDADARLEDDDPLTILRDEGISPKSITTEGARTVLKRLTEAADIDPSGPHDYLTPHGARRGAGETLYRTAGHESAQRQLRHADPSTTSKMYSHIEAGDQADVASDAFDESDT